MNYFWNASLKETLERSTEFASSTRRKTYLELWLSDYNSEKPTSSNQGVGNLAFQRWFHFKEAFSPKFVADTITSRPYDVSTCVDPFGGSGTTALTCRMLGVNSKTCEVNPFLADLIQSKLAPLNAAEFLRAVEETLESASSKPEEFVIPQHFPPTFCEPGRSGRYIFSKDVFALARSILRHSKTLNPDQARLLRVLLGSVLVDNSNVRISGKGRRYRDNWEARRKTPDDLMNALLQAAKHAAEDLERYAGLPKGSHRVMHGDARRGLSRVQTADMALFSPPYPNSFDYTDVYNVELWMLDYLTDGAANRRLRQSTLRSHVQTNWELIEPASIDSRSLKRAIRDLQLHRDSLWNRNIPNMIVAYFADMKAIFAQLARILSPGRDAIVAIGDSRYAGVLIDMSSILPEIVEPLGYSLENRSEIRAMRSSAQHGGAMDLAEHCFVFRRQAHGGAK